MGEKAGREGKGGDQRGGDSLSRESCHLRRKSGRNLQARLILATRDAYMGHAMHMVLKRLQWQVVVLVLLFS